MEQKEKKTAHILIRITPELKKNFEDECERQNRSISNYIETLIKDALKKKGE